MSEAKRIAIMLHPVRTYCRRVLRGITAVGARARWEWLLVSVDVDPLLETLSHDFLHGAIGHFSNPAVRRRVVQSRLPAIDIAPVDRHAGLIRVATDELAVGRLGAAHLLSLGLAHFGFFGTSK